MFLENLGEVIRQARSFGVHFTSNVNRPLKCSLAERLARYSEAHPSVDLRVLATMRHVDFARDDVDLAVRHGDGDWPGLDVTRLCSEQLFAICSPKLLTGRNRLKVPSDVLKWPLLRLDEYNAWERWFALAGVTAPAMLQGPDLNRTSMIIDAAIDVDVIRDRNRATTNSAIGFFAPHYFSAGGHGEAKNDAPALIDAVLEADPERPQRLAASARHAGLIILVLWLAPVALMMALAGGNVR